MGLSNLLTSSLAAISLVTANAQSPGDVADAIRSVKDRFPAKVAPAAIEAIDALVLLAQDGINPAEKVIIKEKMLAITGNASNSKELIEKANGVLALLNNIDVPELGRENKVFLDAEEQQETEKENEPVGAKQAPSFIPPVGSQVKPIEFDLKQKWINGLNPRGSIKELPNTNPKAKHHRSFQIEPVVIGGQNFLSMAFQIERTGKKPSTVVAEFDSFIKNIPGSTLGIQFAQMSNDKKSFVDGPLIPVTDGHSQQLIQGSGPIKVRFIVEKLPINVDKSQKELPGGVIDIADLNFREVLTK